MSSLTVSPSDAPPSSPVHTEQEGVPQVAWHVVSVLSHAETAEVWVPVQVPSAAVCVLVQVVTAPL